MTPQSYSTAGVGHERKDVDVLAILMIVALVLLIGVVSFLTVWGLLRVLQNPTAARTRTHQTNKFAQFPQPALQVAPVVDLAKAEAASKYQLESSGWINRQAGIAHIPIERAMKLELERGLPEVGGGQTRLQMMQARPTTNEQPNEYKTTPATGPTP